MISAYRVCIMTIFHDEVEIEDFEFDEEEQLFYYPCPCGDRFQISKVWAVVADCWYPGTGTNLECGHVHRRS